MFVRDRVISDSLHELRRRKKSGGKWSGLDRGGILEVADKLPMDLSRVINYHPGKGLGLSVTYNTVPQTHCGFLACRLCKSFIFHKQTANVNQSGLENILS